MKHDVSLAEELGHICEAVKDIRGRSHDGREEVDNLVGRLLAAQRLAQALQFELDIYRREEAGHRGRAVCEQLAADQMGDMLTNVIRLDFGAPK